MPMPAATAPRSTSGSFSTSHFDEALRKALENKADQPVVAMEAVAGLLDEYAEEGLRQRLLRLLADRQAIAELAARSYLHGNGFYKIVLAANDSFKLRLHVWFPGSDAEENIHDHRWWFASRILCGQLASAVYEEAAHADAVAYREYLYFGRNAETGARVEEIGSTRLVIRGHRVRQPGDSYVLAPGVLHRILHADPDAVTATLMCQAAPARDWNRLLPSRPLQPDVAQRPLTKAQLVRVLKRYLSSREAN
jgi:hypothetical protein